MDQLDRQIEKHKRELWFRGNLRHVTRIGPQRDAYDFVMGRDRSISAFGPFVLNFHRRLGKTFLVILFCFQAALREKGIIAKLAGPSLTHISDILEEHWPIFMELCPPELEPELYRNEKYTIRNPRWGPIRKWAKSVIKLYGVKNDRGAKMRGGSTDVGAFDECREMMDLMYTWKSILLPTFKGRKDPLALMISTPPDSMDHAWVSHFLKEAKDAGRYMCVPASKDPGWSMVEDEMFAREMGGRLSPDYRREIECELISDSSRLIIPEFAAVDHERDGVICNPYVVSDYPRPPAYFSYTMSDMGGAGKREDHNGILFGYVDFVPGKLVIEDELFLRDFDTESLARVWKDKMQERYDPAVEVGLDRFIAKSHWFADTTPQQLTDLSRLNNLHATQVENIDREVARRFLRTGFARGKILIHQRCKNLIYQLRNGTRLPNGDFARSKLLGHCDCVAALRSLYREVDFETNPNPRPIYTPGKYWVAPEIGSRPASGWDKYFARR